LFSIGSGVVALRQAIVRLDAELETAELCFTAQVLRHVLVPRRACPQVDAFGGLGLHACCPCGLAAGMHTAVSGIGFLAVEARENEHPIPIRLHRRQDRGEREGAFLRRRELRHVHAHRHVDDAEALGPTRRAESRGRQRGDHAVKQRQRDGGAQAAHHGST
jgi:hypothetical protein